MAKEQKPKNKCKKAGRDTDKCAAYRAAHPKAVAQAVSTTSIKRKSSKGVRMAAAMQEYLDHCALLESAGIKYDKTSIMREHGLA